jgi:hypothetical protein
MVQPASGRSRDIAAEDAIVTTWWATVLECQSAIARFEREGAGPAALAEAFSRLDRLEADWSEVAPSAHVRQLAARLLRTHPLRTGDALQLAAAIAAADGNPRSLPFVTFDERLALAASKEGFPIITGA